MNDFDGAMYLPVLNRSFAEKVSAIHVYANGYKIDELTCEEFEFVPSHYFKKLANTDGIWEIRIQVGGNIFRILGFLDGDNVVLLTNGFAKKTQKTPRTEIVLAEDRKREHLRRK